MPCANCRDPKHHAKNCPAPWIARCCALCNRATHNIDSCPGLWLASLQHRKQNFFLLLGYARKGLPDVNLDIFTLEQIRKAAQDCAEYREVFFPSKKPLALTSSHINAGTSRLNYSRPTSGYTGTSKLNSPRSIHPPIPLLPRNLSYRPTSSSTGTSLRAPPHQAKPWLPQPKAKSEQGLRSNAYRPQPARVHSTPFTTGTQPSSKSSRPLVQCPL